MIRRVTVWLAGLTAAGVVMGILSPVGLPWTGRAICASLGLAMAWLVPWAGERDREAKRRRDADRTGSP